MGPLCCLAHQMLELGEDLFDRIEIGAVWRQEQELGASATDRFADGRPFVTAQIVHDDHVAGRECRHEELLDIVFEALAVDRLVEHAWGVDPIAAERREEGHRAPMAVGDLGMKPLANRRPAAQWRHVGLRPGLVDEDEASWIKPALVLLPLLASPGYLWPELFGGQHAFF